MLDAKCFAIKTAWMQLCLHSYSRLSAWACMLMWLGLGAEVFNNATLSRLLMLLLLQLINDDQRGCAWSRALLGLPANTSHGAVASWP
jgi:hypothetical protein